MQRRRTFDLIGAAVVAALVAACGSGGTAGAGTTSDPVAGDAQLSGDAAPPGQLAPEVDANVRGGVLEVVDADGAVLATHGPSEDDAGEAVHATVRPGDQERRTVLALFRVDQQELGVHYELRYLDVDAGGVSELAWLPWRLQIDARVAEVADVAPTPVWSPDGGGVAWIEWHDEATVLRLLRWSDDGWSDAPDTTLYRLREVPAGTQLDTWEDDEHLRFTASTPDGEELEVEIQVGELAFSPGPI